MADESLVTTLQHQLRHGGKSLTGSLIGPLLLACNDSDWRKRNGFEVTEAFDSCPQAGDIAFFRKGASRPNDGLNWSVQPGTSKPGESHETLKYQRCGCIEAFYATTAESEPHQQRRRTYCIKPEWNDWFFKGHPKLSTQQPLTMVLYMVPKPVGDGEQKHKGRKGKRCRTEKCTGERPPAAAAGGSASGTAEDAEDGGEGGGRVVGQKCRRSLTPQRVHDSKEQEEHGFTVTSTEDAAPLNEASVGDGETLLDARDLLAPTSYDPCCDGGSDGFASGSDGFASGLPAAVTADAGSADLQEAGLPAHDDLATWTEGDLWDTI